MHDLKEAVSRAKSLLGDGKIPSERALEHCVILPILQALGWNSQDIDELHPDYSAGKGRVDWALCDEGRLKAFLEQKRPDRKLAAHEEQLLQYSFQQGVGLAILTNGKEWWMYLPLAEGAWRVRKFAVIDLVQHEIEEVCCNLVRFLRRERVCSGEACAEAQKVREQIKANPLPHVPEPPDGAAVALLPATRPSGSLSLWQQTCMDYWTEFSQFVKDSPGPVHPHQSSTDAWYNIAIGSSDCFLYAGIERGRVNVRIEVCFDKRSEYFQALYAQKSEIEAELGGSLDWQVLPDSLRSRIVRAHTDFSPRNRAEWPAQHQWLLENLTAFHDVFRRRVGTLKRRLG